MIWVIIYFLLLILIGLYVYFRKKSFNIESFMVYDRKANFIQVAFSLVALVFGASSVFGLAGYAYIYGFKAIWWTLSGVICLFILSLFFIKEVYTSNSYTITDIISNVFGEKIRFFVSLIIFIAWLMVLSGQIIAGGLILNYFLKNEILSYIVFSLIFSFYTVLIGQHGAIKTGYLQVILLIIGIIIIYLICYSYHQSSNIQINYKLFQNFSPTYFISTFIPIGLSYLFGPDIYTRVFSAKDIKNARYGIILGAIMIFIISIFIVYIGIFSKYIITKVSKTDEILIMIVDKFLSGNLKNLVLVSFISIPLSGADIILITLSKLLGIDIIKYLNYNIFKIKNKLDDIVIIRISMVLVVVISTIISIRLKEIIPALLIAYKIYSVGLIPLIFISLLSLKYNVEIKSGHSLNLINIYLLIIAILILLIELNIILKPFVLYNIIFVFLNTLLLFVYFLINYRKKQKLLNNIK